MASIWVRAVAGCFLATSFLSATAWAYDDDASAEQRQTDQAQGKQAADQFSDAQQALVQGDSVTSRITSSAQLTGRAKRAFESWQTRGWSPQGFVVNRRGRSTWLLTGKAPSGAFRYAFFHIPANP